jgi:hypothetical protein
VSDSADEIPVAPVRGIPRPVLATLAVLVSVAVYLLTQVSMLWWRSNFSWSGFRNYFPSDQLSYLSMVVNGKHGKFVAVEPFTQTGANNYPHLYYTVLGFISRVVGSTPIAAWEIGGIVLQAIVVASIAVASILISRRIWTGLLAAFPLLIGTFSSWHSAGWFTQLSSHAVLWGSFGVLFTLNGESAALSLGCTALVLLLAVLLRRNSGLRSQWVMGLIAALVIGVLANVQTYSFLTIAYIAGYGIATYALASTHRRWLIIPSVVLLPVVFLVGPPVATHVSQLVTLVIGMIPTLPGLIDLIIRSRGKFAIFIGVAILAASPQVVGTWLALRAGDPFLTYRVASTKDLGVGISAGVIAATALLVPLILILIAGIHRKNAIWIGYSIGAAIAWALVAGNDRWGANQEPYRFWIDGFAIVAMTIVPVALSVVFTYLDSGRTLTAPASGKASPIILNRQSAAKDSIDRASVPIGRPVRTIVIAATVFSIVLAGLSARDWALFYHDASKTQLDTYADSADLALAKVVLPVKSGVVITDSCVDPVTLKTVSSVAVEYFNFGMAWPAHEALAEDVITARGEGSLELNVLKPLDVRWLVTASGCHPNWATKYASALTKVKTSTYGTGSSGSYTLWKIATP